MSTPVSAFDHHMDDWKRAQAEPWMRLRYDLAQIYLHHHLPPPPAHILDVGGGNGADSLPLARAGYQITILDYSPAMLADAHAVVQSHALADQVTLIHATLDTLTAQIPPASVHVAFCHNVLQYVDTPARYLAAIRSRLVAGGLLSIINPNPASEALRFACQQYDLVQALEAITTTQHYAPTFEVTVQRYTADQIVAWLASADMSVVAQYGIRCVCDYLADNERKAEPAFYAALRALEITMGTRQPYRDIARFMHVIAQVPHTESPAALASNNAP